MALLISDHRKKLELLKLLLLPLVRFCLRNAYSIQDLTNCAKQVFVAVAKDEILKTGKKANVSRISVMTGMYRIDVTKYLDTKAAEAVEAVNVLGRVIGQWRNDPSYSTRPGTPRVLPIEEFRLLVEGISKDLHPGTVLFELQRLGLVENTPNGLKHVKILFNLEGDPLKVFNLLSTEIDYHIQAAEENVTAQTSLPNLHLVTEYNNVFLEDLPEIRMWLLEQGKAFHKRARNFIAKFDKDITSDKRRKNKEAGGKVTLSAFSFTTPQVKK